MSPGINLGAKEQVGRQDGEEWAGAEKLGFRSCRWDMKQHKGAEGEGQGHGGGGRRPFPFVTPWSPSIHLAEVFFGLCDTGGGCSSLLVALLFQALSSLQGGLSQGLVPGHFPGKGTSLVVDGAAVQCLAPGTELRRCAWIGAPAVPRIAVVAGPNPPVIIFYCRQSDITTHCHHSWVKSLAGGWLCSTGSTPSLPL